MNSPAPALLIVVLAIIMAGCAYFVIPPIIDIADSYGTFDVEHMIVPPLQAVVKQ